jgi:hypothetical protein
VKFALILSAMVSAQLAFANFAAATPCQSAETTTQLLVKVVVAHWQDLRPEDLVRQWPDAKVNDTVPAWPASVGATKFDSHDQVICQELFLLREHGGIEQLSIFFSGSDEEVADAIHKLTAAFGHALTTSEESRLIRNNLLALGITSLNTPGGQVEIAMDLHVGRDDSARLLAIGVFTFH